MKTMYKILSLSILLLSSVVSLAQTPQTVGGMTIFNIDNFHAVDNTITVQKDFVVVINTDVVSVIQLNASCLKNLDLYGRKPSKKAFIHRKSIALKSIKIEDKTKSSQFISTSNSPFNNSFYIGVNSVAGIVSTTTSQKYTPLCHFEEQEIPFEKALQSITQKLFQSHETIILSSNYSKTSRIRPPPVA
jgi:hypothetical protein